MYKYKDIPLTPAIAADAILAQLSAKLLRRDEIVDAVVKHHLKNGGLECNANTTQTIKKALSDLAGKGLAENVKQGYWRIGDKTALENKDVGNADSLRIVEDDIYADQEDNDFGHVYLYFYKIYKDASDREGGNIWPCKIGATERDAKERILDQIGTAMPERPVVGLVVQCKNPFDIETILHKILLVRGRCVSDSPGSEWYNTCPDEVLSIIEMIGIEFKKVS